MPKRLIGFAGAAALLAACGGGAETPSEKTLTQETGPERASLQKTGAEKTGTQKTGAGKLGAPGDDIAAVCARAMGWQADRVGAETERGSRFLRGAKPCCAKGAGLAGALDEKQRLMLWHKYFAFDPTKISYEEQQASRAAIDEARSHMGIQQTGAVNDVMLAVEVCIQDLDK